MPGGNLRLDMEVSVKANDVGIIHVAHDDVIERSKERFDRPG